MSSTRECIERLDAKEENRGMHQAANENFESGIVWQPGSQAGHLEKLAALVEIDS
jgi:hypothetical protein